MVLATLPPEGSSVLLQTQRARVLQLRAAGQGREEPGHAIGALGIFVEAPGPGLDQKSVPKEFRTLLLLLLQAASQTRCFLVKRLDVYHHKVSHRSHISLPPPKPSRREGPRTLQKGAPKPRRESKLTFVSFGQWAPSSCLHAAAGI